MYNTSHRKRYKKSHNKSRHTPTTKTIIGVVHAHWCGQCTSLMPNWMDMKDQLRNVNTITVLSIEESENSESRIKDINNTHLKNSHQKLQVDGYPTIFKITNKGVLEYYNGTREVADLIKWAKMSVNKTLGGKSRKNKKKVHNKTTNHSYRRR